MSKAKDPGRAVDSVLDHATEHGASHVQCNLCKAPFGWHEAIDPVGMRAKMIDHLLDEHGDKFGART